MPAAPGPRTRSAPLRKQTAQSQGPQRHRSLALAQTLPLPDPEAAGPAPPHRRGAAGAAQAAAGPGPGRLLRRHTGRWGIPQGRKGKPRQPPRRRPCVAACPPGSAKVGVLDLGSEEDGRGGLAAERGIGISTAQVGRPWAQGGCGTRSSYVPTHANLLPALHTGAALSRKSSPADQAKDPNKPRAPSRFTRAKRR